MKINIRKKIVCFMMAAAMAVFTMTACGDQTDTPSSAPLTTHKFGLEDLTANDVKLGMTPDEVKEKLGEPDKQERLTEGQFIYGSNLTMQYGKMFLSFYDIKEGDNITLSSISADSPDVIFAGGLHVGSTKEEVLAAFTQEENAPDLILADQKYGTFIYGDMTNDDFIEKKPTGTIECAYIQDLDAETDNYYMIIYNYYNPLQWSDDGSSFTGDFYHLVFYMDTESDKVKTVLLEHLAAV